MRLSLAHPQRRLHHRFPGQAFARIEINDDMIDALEVFDNRIRGCSSAMLSIGYVTSSGTGGLLPDHGSPRPRLRKRSRDKDSPMFRRHRSMSPCIRHACMRRII